MDQLIFFAIIIVLSILESIARSRKAKRQRSGEVPDPPEPERFEWAQRPSGEQRPPWAQKPPTEKEPWAGEEIPSYDDEPSYDEVAGAEATSIESEPRPRESAELPSAEDIWAEIAGLSTERRAEPETRRPVPEYAPQRPAPEERRPAPVARPSESTQVAVPRRSLPNRIEEHAIHLAHAGYGTDPSERGISEQDVRYARVERLGDDAAAARDMLLGGGATLRQAMILQEVLGPPAAMRDG